LATLRRSIEKEPLSKEQEPQYALCIVRLLQDDDSETRDYGYAAADSKLVEGKAVETILRNGGSPLVQLVLEDEDLQFGKHCFPSFAVSLTDLRVSFAAEDLEILSNPSSLLFAIEKPNIYRDDHLVPSLLLGDSPSKITSNLSGTISKRLTALAKVVENGRGLEAGPLGREGNEVVCRWATPLVSAYDSGACSNSDGPKQAVDTLRSCE